jgi:ligand-binding sensor domain-containing protein
MHPDKPKLLTFSWFIAALELLCCLDANLFAEEYGFDGWTTANGLPQNTVRGIMQTPDGYLWLSTLDAKKHEGFLKAKEKTARELLESARVENHKLIFIRALSILFAGGFFLLLQIITLQIILKG